MSLSNDQLVTVDQAAEKLSTTRKSLWDWSKNVPEFPKPVTIGRQSVRYRLSDLDAYLERQQGAPQDNE